MSSSFALIYQLRVEGALKARSDFESLTDAFKRGEVSIEDVNKSLRQMDRANAQVASSVNRATNAFRAAHPNLAILERSMSRIASIGRIAVGIFDSWNILQLVMQGRTKELALAQDEVEKATREYLIALNDLGVESPITIEALGKLTAAQANLSREQENAANQARNAAVQLIFLGTMAVGAIPQIISLATTLGSKGPLALALVGLGIAIGAFALAWSQNWFGIRDKLGPIIDKIKATISPVLEELLTGVTNVWTDRINQMIADWERLGAFIETILARFIPKIGEEGLIKTIREAREAWLKWLEDAKEAERRFWDATRTWLDNLIAGIQRAIAWLQTLLGMGGAASGARLTFEGPRRGEFGGVLGAQRGAVMVGEAGPELLLGARATKLFTAGEEAGLIAGLGRGRGGGVTIINQFEFHGFIGDVDRLVDLVDSKMKTRVLELFR